MLSNPSVEGDHRYGRSNMNGRVLDVVLVTATVIAGLFFPVVSAFAFPDGLINLPWGSVYGLGFAALHWIIGLYRGGVLGLMYGLAGFVAWPAVVAYCLARLLRSVRHGGSARARLICRVLILLSLMVAIPIPSVQGSPFESWPLFTKYIDF